MSMIFPVMLMVMAIAVLVPLWVFAVECALARTKQPSETQGDVLKRPVVAVLIPAHNEALGIAATIGTVRGQLQAGDRMLVVADNCTDATAIVARAAGAEVAERTDNERRGKGYALDFGLRQLDQNRPQVVVMVDADCDVGAGAIDALAGQVVASGRPAQAVYLMEPPLEPTPRDLISAFAFIVKNQVRPLGCRRLGWPCLMTGTGMAFGWDTIRNAPLASGNIVEDMQLGLDLAVAGAAPLLCAEARVTGRLPAQDAAARTQRTRWEQGHVRTILANVPRLLAKGVLGGRPGLIALALDLCVPPLSMLVMGWTVAMVLMVGAWMAGTSPWPAMVVAAGGVVMLVAVLAAWCRFARNVVPLGTLLTVPFYVLWKIPLYLGFVLRPQKAWVRTAR